MTDTDSPSNDYSQQEPLGGIGKAVSGVLLALCVLIATAVLLSWASWLVVGTGLGFWPAIALALGILAIFIVKTSR